MTTKDEFLDLLKDEILNLVRRKLMFRLIRFFLLQVNSL